MPDDVDPITEWIDALPDGDSEAQRKVWQAFAIRVASQAKRCLRGVSRRESDEEDVAVQVLNSLFQRLADGRQEPVDDRVDFWHLLLKMTRNKSASAARHKLAKKRGGGKVRGESAFGNDKQEHDNLGLNDVEQQRPTPQEAFEEAQHFAAMLESLDNDEQRQIVMLRMADHSDQEIADMLGCGKRTVQRRLDQIRSQLSADE